MVYHLKCGIYIYIYIYRERERERERERGWKKERGEREIAIIVQRVNRSPHV